MDADSGAVTRPQSPVDGSAGQIQLFERFYRETSHFDRFLGMTLSVLSPGEIEYRLTIGDQHLSPTGASHGGVMAAMMDAVLGVTALSWAIPRDQLCATVEFKLNYFAPAHRDDCLVGRGQLDFTGSRLVVSSGKIINLETGQAVASGMGTFNLYPIAKRTDLLSRLKQEPEA